MKTTRDNNEAREPSYIHQALKIKRRAKLHTPYAENEKCNNGQSGPVPVRATTYNIKSLCEIKIVINCYTVKETFMHTEPDYEKCVQVIMYVYEHMYDER